MDENLLAIVTILAHVALGGYIFRAFLVHFVPDEYQPKPPRVNVRRVK